MLHYAKPLAKLVAELEHLPGIGPKSAQRMAFHILRQSQDDAAHPHPEEDVQQEHGQGGPEEHEADRDRRVAVRRHQQNHESRDEDDQRDEVADGEQQWGALGAGRVPLTPRAETWAVLNVHQRQKSRKQPAEA